MSMTPDAFFAALSNDTRLGCLLLLQQEGELCVCELTHALGLSQPMISRHLALLRENGLVQDRRKGLWIYYRIHDELPVWAQEILALTTQHLAEHHPFKSSHTKLCDMPNRPGARCCA